ncbi:type VI secretion system Vgr family protein [Melittangium boletus]|uniref:type VI secretion system Vgr family protein n=1 Tax=Melittangium boletus TaxID=83453 RepID=UPI003DA474E5
MSDWKTLLTDAGQTVQTAQRVADATSGVTGTPAAQAVQTLQTVARTVSTVTGVEESGWASQAASLISGALRLESVRFAFASVGELTGAWRVLTFRLREGLLETYSCVVDLASENLFADPDVLLGTSCTLAISRDARTRLVHGIAHRVEHLGSKDGNALARVHVAPALWALSQRVDSYIFQEMTVPEILSEVLKESLNPFKRDVRLEFTQQYPRREYCVQHRESDLDFVLRLMEEEGISFYFDHSGETEELVLTDANECYPALKTMDGLPLGIHGPEADLAGAESIRSIDFAHELQPNRVVIRDFDWSRIPEDAKKQLLHEEDNGESSKLVALERYEHQSPMTLSGYDAGAGSYTEGDGKRQSRLRLQAHAARERHGQGHGNVIGMCPGLTFALSGYGRAEMDQKYLLSRVEHFGRAPEELTSHVLEESEEQSRAERYHNRFECLPVNTVFRPERRRSRPRIFGVQTATVVGPAGQEIFTDTHGRIKVQFHWDRVGKRDAYSSCFLRVVQGWSGGMWGSFFLPRIGMEVLVDFIEGDPDRPLVVGCVYNGQNLTPYELPKHQTRSTIKTRSTPRPKDDSKEVGFNELRFEDLADQEEIFLHAQKDFNEVVLNMHNTSVGANQTNSVKGNQTETIDKNQTLAVKGNRTRTIDKDETVTVHQNRTKTVDKDETRTIHGSRTTTIDVNETVTISGERKETVTGKETITLQNERVTSITQNDQLSVNADKSTQVTGSYTIAVGPNFVVTQGGTTLALSEGHADLQAEKSIRAHNPSGVLELAETGGVVRLVANNTLELVCGNASIVLDKSGTITLSGTQQVALGVQQSTITLEPPGVTVSGPQLTSSAIGIHEITGALIKIN